MSSPGSPLRTVQSPAGRSEKEKGAGKKPLMLSSPGTRSSDTPTPAEKDPGRPHRESEEPGARGPQQRRPPSRPRSHGLGAHGGDAGPAAAARPAEPARARAAPRRCPSAPAGTTSTRRTARETEAAPGHLLRSRPCEAGRDSPSHGPGHDFPPPHASPTGSSLSRQGILS